MSKNVTLDKIKETFEKSEWNFEDNKRSQKPESTNQVKSDLKKEEQGINNDNLREEEESDSDFDPEKEEEEEDVLPD